MSTNYSNTKQLYHHLSEVKRGKIKAYLSEGLKLAEIARHLGKNRSTISRELKPDTVKQVKPIKRIYYLNLEKVSKPFLTAFTEAMTNL